MRAARGCHLHRQCMQGSNQRGREHPLNKGLLSCLAGLGVLLCVSLAGCAKKAAQARPGPPEVEVADAATQNVPVYTELVSQLNGPVNAEITPKVQGYLLQQNYQNGFLVRKGQLLFTLDPRQYQAGVEQAEAQLGVAQANLARTNNDVRRDTPLAAQRAIPQRDLDTDLTNQQAMKAQVEAADASLDNAKLNLAWTKVYSPIEGIAGAANAQIGDLVGTTTKMTTVSQVNPIWAYFNVSEDVYLKFAPQINAFISGKLGKGTHHELPVELIQANGVPYPLRGRIIYVNRQVGTGTGTIQMAAEFPNSQSVLRPGGYGRVRIKVGDSANAVVVPQPAVIEVQSEYMLVVLTPDGRATFRPVKVGERTGPNWVITEGLKPGERVVVEGTQRIQTAIAQAPDLAKAGIPVIAKPYVPPTSAGGSD